MIKDNFYGFAYYENLIMGGFIDFSQHKDNYDWTDRKVDSWRNSKLGNPYKYDTKSSKFEGLKEIREFWEDK